jgi:hypothetical protein
VQELRIETCGKREDFSIKFVLSYVFKWPIASLARYSPQVISAERAFKMIKLNDIEIPKSEQNHSIFQLLHLGCVYLVLTEREIPD